MRADSEPTRTPGTATGQWRRTEPNAARYTPHPTPNGSANFVHFAIDPLGLRTTDEAPACSTIPPTDVPANTEAFAAFLSPGFDRVSCAKGPHYDHCAPGHPRHLDRAHWQRQHLPRRHLRRVPCRFYAHHPDAPPPPRRPLPSPPPIRGSPPRHSPACCLNSALPPTSAKHYSPTPPTPPTLPATPSSTSSATPTKPPPTPPSLPSCASATLPRTTASHTHRSLAPSSPVGYPTSMLRHLCPTTRPARCDR